MANEELKNLTFTFTRRSAAKRGPTSSDRWNDTVIEIATDLSFLTSEWNNKLVKIIEKLPNGSESTSINAFINGLDGKNLWVDSAVTSSSTETTYYDATNSRPKTVKESLDALHTRVNNAIEDLQEDISENAAALSATEKASIGWHIFDSNKVSSSVSLDGKSENNRLNVLQLARDVYGASYATLDNDGNANLTNSVRAMVNALLQLHNGAWDNDISLSHAGVGGSSTQSDVANSSSYNDSFAAVPTNLQEDLNQIRTELKDAKGTLAWTTAQTPLYAGGADSLEDLLTTTAGTGAKAATNPWGYDFSDLDGLSTALDEMTTTVVGSGLPSDLPAGETAQDVLAWMVGADQTIDGQYFRRADTAVSGSGPFVIYHGRNLYPVVQFVQVSPTVTVSGQYSYEVEHDDVNQFTLTLPAGVSLTGTIIAIW